MPTAEELKHLFAEFPRDAVSWRAQSVTRDGDKALALAYIDARDVMDRLDHICGATDWQDRYEVHGSKTICYLSIRIDGEWITKADGAGDSDVEAEKGAISDAFKRAAVRWGVGRYLYDMDTPWVPCESYERNGKMHWKRWKADPWTFVKGAEPPKRQTGYRDDGTRTSYALKKEQPDLMETLVRELNECKTLVSFEKLKAAWRKKATEEKWNKPFTDSLKEKLDHRESEIRKDMERLAESSSEQLADLPTREAIEHSLKMHPVNAG